MVYNSINERKGSGDRMVEISGAFRKKKVQFSQVSNFALRDTKLSLKAKGLYSLIQSYITLENFILYKTTLKKQCLEGSTAFESAWSELKTMGYLKQYKSKNNGGFFIYEYDLLDIKEEIIHTPKTYPMDNPVGGKGGLYNKTDLNNTYSNNTGILHHLEELNNEYVNAYTKIMDYNGYKHKKVSDINYSHISNCIDKLSADIDIDEFTDGVCEYFNTISKGNDGDILAFLKASMRIFEIDVADY